MRERDITATMMAEHLDEVLDGQGPDLGSVVAFMSGRRTPSTAMQWLIAGALKLERRDVFPEACRPKARPLNGQRRRGPRPSSSGGAVHNLGSTPSPPGANAAVERNLVVPIRSVRRRLETFPVATDHFGDRVIRAA